MRGQFSKSLQKYYSREKARIVFTNGMSLNGLALEMSERLGFREVDASVVSRVLAGKRIFNQRQLAVFCEIVGVKSADRILLRTSLHSEIYSKFEGRYLLGMDSNQFEIILEKNLSLVIEANEKGSSTLALDWCFEMETLLRREIMKTTNSQMKQKLHRLLFLFLEQHSISILRREMPDTAFDKVWSVLKEMLGLAKELRCNDCIGITYAKMGDILSLVGGLRHSHTLLVRSSNYFKKSCEFINPAREIYPIGYAMLNEAYLGNVGEFSKLKKRIYSLIPESSLSDKCEMYSLVAKSKITIGLVDDLESDFLNGWEVYGKIKDGNSKLYRSIQLSRTQVEAATRGYKFHNDGKLKRITADVLYSSKHFGYKRYYLTTKQMIKKSGEILNFNLSINDLL